MNYEEILSLSATPKANTSLIKKSPCLTSSQGRSPTASTSNTSEAPSRPPTTRGRKSLTSPPQRYAIINSAISPQSPCAILPTEAPRPSPPRTLQIIPKRKQNKRGG